MSRKSWPQTRIAYLQSPWTGEVYAVKEHIANQTNFKKCQIKTSSQLLKIECRQEIISTLHTM